jgi:HD-like signal output (HDOD) protein
MSPLTESRSLADRITELIATDEVQLPPLPEMVVRLRDLLAQGDAVEARDVAGLMSKEPAIAASVLRIANSAAFGGLRPVTDLHQAITRLGLRQVGSIVTALLVKGQFAVASKVKQPVLHLLWDHSLASAFACRRLATKSGADREEAFLAGLLHDTGKLMVLKAIDHLEQRDAGAVVTRPVIDELMELLHCKLGHAVLAAWRIPDPIAAVALRHEEPASDQDPLLLTVQVANLVSEKLGFHLAPRPELDLLSEPAVELLGLSDLEIASLMVDLEDELAEARRLL